MEVGADVVNSGNALPPFGEGRALKAHPFTHHCHQSPAVLKPAECAFNVPRPVTGAVLYHAPAGGAERRIHQHCSRLHVGGQQVVNDFGVNAMSLKAESFSEQREAAGVDFVANHRRGDGAGPDGEAAGSR